MEITDRKESIKEPAMDAYLLKKIKGWLVRNEQKQFFIKWENFSHSESNWEPQENMSAETREFFRQGNSLSYKCLF